MMKEKMLKRIAAGAVALTMLGVGLPADSGFIGLSDVTMITASAADASTVFGEPTAESGYKLENKLEEYTLTEDITTLSYIHVPAGVTATIDLNGHTIDRGLTEFVGDGHVIQIDAGGTLTIKDTSKEKTGTIKGGYTYNGAGINNQGGSCILENITVTGNTAVTDLNGEQGCGGGICNDDGYLKMTDCTVTGNTADAGGGIYNKPCDADSERGTAKLVNVTVTQNTASRNGGGICNHGELTVSGCTVQNNTAGQSGGGIYIDATGRDTSFWVADTVTGNTAANGEALYVHSSGHTNIEGKLIADGCDILANSCPFTVIGEFNSDSDIAVHIPKDFNGYIAYDYSTYNPTLDPADIFTYAGSYAADFSVDEGNVKAAYTGFTYISRSWDSEQKKVVEETKTIADGSYRFPENANDTYGDYINLGSPNGEWYVVDRDITVDELVRCFGSVNLLLRDGATLTCNKGIVVENNNSLNIYGQTGGSGKLVSKGEKYNAGIGSQDHDASGSPVTGTINIYGGIIESTGGVSAAGIGGGDENAAGNITIYGGTVTATGGANAAGIGDGKEAETENGRITIYGGTVTANTVHDGAGIGGGYGNGNTCGIEININGGNVLAYGTGGGAAIGSGYASNLSGSLNISGGNVYAKTSDYKYTYTGTHGGDMEMVLSAPGFGAGEGGDMTGNIRITGGNVTVDASECRYNPAIGTGTTRKQFIGNVEITGGTVTLKNYSPASGYQLIGGYVEKENNGTLTIGDNMSVKQGTDTVPVSASDRISTLRSSDIHYAVITECTHGEFTYSVTDTQHTAQCKYCNYTETENHTYDGSTCTACGKRNYPDGIGEHLAGHSLSLTGNIGVNFYMELDDAVAADENAYMHFTLPNGKTQDVKIDQATTKTISGKTYYVFQCNVAAKEMTDTITAQMFSGDKSGQVYDYTVKDYADYLFANAYEDDGTTVKNQDYVDAIPLVKAMLNYGSYSQTYFSHNTDALANADITDTAVSAVTAEIVSKPYDSSTAILPSGITLEGANLALESETVLNLYFSNTTGKELTFTTSGNVTLDQKQDSTYTKVTITGIAAQYLDNDVTVNVTVAGDDTAYSVQYSPMNYCYNTLSRDTTATRTEALKDVMRAFYLYNQEAKTYFTAHSN